MQRARPKRGDLVVVLLVSSPPLGGVLEAVPDGVDGKPDLSGARVPGIGDGTSWGAVCHVGEMVEVASRQHWGCSREA